MPRSFEATLADIERGPATPSGLPLAPRVLPEAPPGGHHSLWEFAAAWTPEADPAPPRAEPPPPAPPSLRPADVAAELKLDALRSAAEVARARRRFMWDNHPDRMARHGLEFANRRVAVANMLLDNKLAALRRDARRR